MTARDVHLPQDVSYDLSCGAVGGGGGGVDRAGVRPCDVFNNEGKLRPLAGVVDVKAGMVVLGKGGEIAPLDLGDVSAVRLAEENMGLEGYVSCGCDRESVGAGKVEAEEVRLRNGRWETGPGEVRFDETGGPKSENRRSSGKLFACPCE